MMAMKKAEKLSTLPHGAVIDTKPGKGLGDVWSFESLGMYRLDLPHTQDEKWQIKV